MTQPLRSQWEKRAWEDLEYARAAIRNAEHHQTRFLTKAYASVMKAVRMYDNFGQSKLIDPRPTRSWILACVDAILADGTNIDRFAEHHRAFPELYIHLKNHTQVELEVA